MLVAKNNWQLPAVMGLLTNVGVKIPGFIVNRMAPWRAMIGGHGSADTQKILMAIEGPGAAKGKVVSDPDFKKIINWRTLPSHWPTSWVWN